MVKLIATAESMEQAEQLLDAGVDTLYIGEDYFGLRLPHSFSQEEITAITSMAHDKGKEVVVSMNALFHNDRLKKVVPYLQFLESIHVDAVAIGDPGVIRMLQKNEINIPFIYDAQTMVTSSNQVNFWAKRGAIGAVLAREIPYEELKGISEDVQIPTEVLVYGATCIHQSKRPLVQNYFNYVGEEVPDSMEKRELFLSENKKEDTHYSIYEDINGTHVFATDDVNLMTQLEKLYEIDMRHWKLDGIFTKGETFVHIAKLFDEARTHLDAGTFTEEVKEELNNRLHDLHPSERTLDEGFFLKDPDSIQSC